MLKRLAAFLNINNHIAFVANLMDGHTVVYYVFPLISIYFPPECTFIFIAWSSTCPKAIHIPVIGRHSHMA